MTLKERRFYRLAILISLALHAAFLVIYIPHIRQKLLDKPVEIDTFAVGVVEMPFGNAMGGPPALIATVSPGALNGRVLPKKAIPAGGKPNAAPLKSSAASEGKAKEKPAAGPLIVAANPAPTKQPQPADAVLRDSETPVPGDKGKDGTGGKNGDGQGTSTKNIGGKGTDDKNGLGNGDGGLGGPGGPGTAPFVAAGLGTGEQMSSGGGGGFPYPKNLLNEEKEGDVEVQLLIKTDGSLEGYNVLHSSGDQRLVKPVKTYIERQLKKCWKPYNQNYYVNILFSFKASSGKVKITLEKSETRP